MLFFSCYFCVVILCVNRSRSSFILYRIVKRHSSQSNVRRIWTCADNASLPVSMKRIGCKNNREKVATSICFYAQGQVTLWSAVGSGRI